jgi:thiol:disulfide interchange protein DsbA
MGRMSMKMKSVAVLAAVACLSMMGGATPAATAGAAELQGKFEQIKEPSTHVPGKVKLIEFADFYCPHCHRFEQEALPILEKEFGNKLEVTMVGFPVIPAKLPTAFEMYEQAKTMGKGAEMKRVLFRTIHKDKTHLLDRVIRESLIKEVGLDVKVFEAGLASGKPLRAVDTGKEWGMKVNVQQTPTILLDGNIKVEAIDPDNLRLVIRSILDGDKSKHPR